MPSSRHSRDEAASTSRQALYESAAALGLNRSGVAEIVQTLERRHFYKSMTSYADHRIWQDVYHVPSALGVIYVKFTADVLAEFLLLSFKEKDNG